jgi:DNA ligase (NAD+)
MAGLSEEIRRHDYLYYLYYVLDRPEISDEEYERLYLRLRGLEEAFPDLVGKDSLPRRVAGAPLPSFPEVPHLVPLLSLDSVTDPEEVRRLNQRMRETLSCDRVISACSWRSMRSWIASI